MVGARVRGLFLHARGDVHDVARDGNDVVQQNDVQRVHDHVHDHGQIFLVCFALSLRLRWLSPKHTSRQSNITQKHIIISIIYPI